MMNAFGDNEENYTLYFVKALDMQNIHKGYYIAQADRKIVLKYGGKPFELKKGD